MRSRGLTGNSVALCGDNFARLCFGPTALLDEVGFSRLVFPKLITDYKIDVQQTPQTPRRLIQEIGEGVDYSGTRVRAKLGKSFHRRRTEKKVKKKRKNKDVIL